MNIEDVQKLAVLARVDISRDEAQALTGDMNTILEYIKQIENAHSDMLSTGDPLLCIQSNITREDTLSSATPDVLRLIKKNFPKERNGFLEINKIIQND